jgi:uncharacterized protein YdhG (YjbR/CyaY superfamily)
MLGPYRHDDGKKPEEADSAALYRMGIASTSVACAACYPGYMARHKTAEESQRQPIVSWEFSKLLATEAGVCGLLYCIHRRGGWRDVWKFLSGSFLATAGILYYLAAMNLSVPILGTRYIESPQVSGRRAVVHTALCAVCLYLGFIRKDPQPWRALLADVWAEDGIGGKRHGPTLESAWGQGRKESCDSVTPIDDYLQNVEANKREELKRIRALAENAVPSAEEAISYGMPTLKYEGMPFLGFNAHKKHIGIYPYSSEVIERLKEQLHDYELSSGAIRIPLDRPISEDTLKQIIDCRLQQIRAKKKANS